jgi:hypothetical protein
MAVLFFFSTLKHKKHFVMRDNINTSISLLHTYEQHLYESYLNKMRKKRCQIDIQYQQNQRRERKRNCTQMRAQLKFTVRKIISLLIFFFTQGTYL